jgi:hypothetical protein
MIYIPNKLYKKFNLHKKYKGKRRQGMVTCCGCHKKVLEKDTELKLFKRIGKSGAAYRPCCKKCIKEKK